MMKADLHTDAVYTKRVQVEGVQARCVLSEPLRFPETKFMIELDDTEPLSVCKGGYCGTDWPAPVE